MTHKFKVGDKVVAVRTDYPNNFPIGTVGTVVELLREDHYQVSNDEGTSEFNNGPWCFGGDELKAYVAEVTDTPVTKIIHITYCGVTITLDAQMQSSRQFAEKLLDLAYGKETNV